jgi:hypothetical protein
MAVRMLGPVPIALDFGHPVVKQPPEGPLQGVERRLEREPLQVPSREGGDVRERRYAGCDPVRLNYGGIMVSVRTYGDFAGGVASGPGSSFASQVARCGFLCPRTFSGERGPYCRSHRP